MEDTKLSLPVKTGKQFVFVDTYRCFNMSIVILIFYMGEDLFSQAFNFAVFFFTWSRKTRN